MGTMTPKNREELMEGLYVLIGHYWAGMVDTTTVEKIINHLDAVGLAIVPKEPTEEMLQACMYEDDDPANYRAMLEASPFKGKE
jgi:hypothetical protein